MVTTAPLRLLLLAGLATTSVARAQAPANLTDQVNSFLVEDGWNPQLLEDGTGYRMPFQGDSDAWVCVVQVNEGDQQVFFYSVLQRTIPAIRRDAVNEYLTRANHGMILGSFQMGMDNGEVRYKTAIDIEGGRLSTGMLQKLSYTNVLTMNRYLAGLNHVVFRGEDPEKAVAWAESQPASTGSSGSSSGSSSSGSSGSSSGSSSSGSTSSYTPPDDDGDVYVPPKNPIQVRGYPGYGGAMAFRFLGDDGGDRTTQIGAGFSGSYSLSTGSAFGVGVNARGSALYSLNNASSFGLGAEGGASMWTSPGPLTLTVGGMLGYDGYGKEASSAYVLPYAMGVYLIGGVSVRLVDAVGLEGNWRSGFLFDADRRGGGLALFDEAGFDAGVTVSFSPVVLRAGYMMQFNVAGDQQGIFIASSF